MPSAETIPPIDISWTLALSVIIIAVNGFFVAAEFALVTSRPARLKQAANEGSRAARIVVRMLEDPDRAIAAVQLGITASSILLGIVAEESLTQLLTPLVAPILGRFASEAVAIVISGVLVLLILSFFLMVVGEQAPKIIALRSPERTVRFVAYPMHLFAKLTAPFVWMVDQATALVLRLVGIRGSTAMHGTLASIEELKALVREGGSVGILEREEQQMLYRVFEFGDRVVREVMTPRPNIVGIERGQTVAELLHVFRDQRHSRFPIYAEILDQIVGVVTIKDLLAYLIDHPAAKDERIDALDVMQPPMTVPESRLVGELFAEMRSAQTGLAIVIDEFGGTAGLVTIEQLVEAIVGPMTDEWTRQPEAREVEQNVYEVSAQLHVDKVNERFGLTLEEADSYETIAGLILHHLRRIPTVGQELTTSGYRLRVLAMDGPKITRVRIEKHTSLSL